MKHCTIMISAADNQQATIRSFAEFFFPIYEAGRADIVDVDETSVITFLDDEDLVVMNLIFGSKATAIEPPHDWEARAKKARIK